MDDAYDMSPEEFNEYLISVFRALLSSKKFKAWLNDNYIIRHTMDPESHKLIKVEIVEETPKRNYN